MILRTGLLVLWMVVVLAGCGGEEAATDGDVDTLRADTVAVVDSLIDGPVEDTLVGDEVGEGPDVGDAPTVGDPPPPVEPTEEEPSDEEPTEVEPGGEESTQDSESDDADAPPLAARYQLATVEGESLPVTIGMGPECELQLANGSLWIRENLAFELRTTIQEVCGGERSGDQVHSAEGTVSRDGMRLTFGARYDSLFATAYGRYLPEGHIVIEMLETEGGEQEVEWRFLR